MVSGKTVGIIGMGRIGQAIARRCHHGFGMQVVFHNRSKVELGALATQRDLPEVLAADFVVIAVPGGGENRHLIDAQALALMAPHGLLINIARGDIVDEAALVSHLAAGRIAGAGLDVYEHEPQVSAGLLALENVTLLPHLGTAVEAVRVDMGLMAVANLVAQAEGRPLLNPV